MALSKEQIQKAYIAFFNRPADVTGLNNWLNYTGGEQDLLDTFSASAEYTDLFVGKTTEQVVYTIYRNLLNRDPDTSGLNTWVNGINAGVVTIGSLAYDIITAAGTEDQKTIQAKLDAAIAFTDYLSTHPDASKAYEEKGAEAGPIVKDWFSQIKESGTNTQEVIDKIDSTGDDLAKIGSGGTTPTPGSTIWIGGSDPTIPGTDGNNNFIAGVDQINDNTIIDGLGGYDSLSITIKDNLSIAPTVRNVEAVSVRVQHTGSPTGQDNNIADDATLDADRFEGVLRWEDNHSRTDLKIEDVKILDSQITRDITVAFVESDAGHVDYALYFDQSSLRNRTDVSGTLVATLLDIYGTYDTTAGTGYLENVAFNRLAIKIDGQIHNIDFRQVNGPTSTYQDLRDAISDGIAANPALSAFGLQVTLKNESVQLLDTQGKPTSYYAPAYIEISATGHTLDTGSWTTQPGTIVPGNTNIATLQKVANSTSSGLVTSTIELDYVGRGDRGGDLVIGSLSTGATDTSLGVQQFDISVLRDSKLEVISSTNNTLQVVNIKNSGTYKYLGAYEYASGTTREGNLLVKGDSRITTLIEGLKGGDKIGPFDTADIQAGSQQYIDGATQAQFNGYGFTDVKTIDASNFRGQLDLSAILTANVVGKYLNLVDQASNLADADNVKFNYDLGSNNDILDVSISAANLAAAGTTTREDFVLAIKGAGGDDVLSTAIYEGVPSDVVTKPVGVSSWGHVYQGGSDNLGLANGTAAAWYNNSKENANLSIEAGSGNDTINTFGSGDWKITLGTGNDTYYADNSAQKAVWVFNTANQKDTGTAERELGNLKSGENDNYIAVYDDHSVSNGLTGTSNEGRQVNGAGGATVTEYSGLYGLKLRVVYQDVSGNGPATAVLPDTTDGQGVYISSVVSVPTPLDNRFLVTDLNINQAIKKAINDDPTLNKLLVATDGPANTLVVTALSDGKHIDVNDLQIEFAIPHWNGSATSTLASGEKEAWNTAIKGINWTDAHLLQGRIDAFTDLLLGSTNTIYGTTGTGNSKFDGYGPDAGTGYSGWFTANKVGADAGKRVDYSAAFAQKSGADIDGINSLHVSDNHVIVDGSSSDHDVVVLSTGADSNDTIVWNGSTGNGTTTVVNFDTKTNAPPTAATYKFNFDTTLFDATHGFENGDKFAIHVPGVGTTGDILVSTNWDGTFASINSELDVLLSGWNPDHALTNVLGGVTDVTYTQGSAAFIGDIGAPKIIAGGNNVGGDTLVPQNLDFLEGTFTPYVTNALGDDWLDFTAYNARWLGVATLNDKGFVATSGWDRANDVQGAHESKAFSDGATLPEFKTVPPGNIDWEDYTVRTNDKYITLTRAYGKTATTSEESTLYKVELWTVNGSLADAYLETIPGNDAKDSAVTIGYVDLGKVIENSTIVDHIDYIL